MIPILKKGKDPKKANSYRPVSLASCVVKTMERIANEPEVVSGNGEPPCTRTGRILTVSKHRGSSHLFVSRN